MLWADRSKNHPPDRDYEVTLWSPDLLGFDPENHRLGLVGRDRRLLQIYEEATKNSVDRLNPNNTHPVVNELSGSVAVREGGYVLPPEDNQGFLSPTSLSRVSGETILQMIEDAKKGKNLPFEPHAWKMVFPRVDLPTGTRVEILTLNGWTFINLDQVVLANRTLVEREMVHPFAHPDTK